MTADQWASVESHFAALSDRPPADWAAALSAIGDAVVRAEVAALLEHKGKGAKFASAIAAMVSRVALDDLHEQRIGAYRLVRRLGQGGQGAVFEAVRDDGSFHQRVAIKVVKWDIDSEVARRLFRQERQILAGLEHPHIARLLDGGETPEGTPFLVMEYVDGLPLTTAARDWSLRRKLNLLMQVAEAVSFAHRNLIVHRDLKPANILVTADGTPRLLDFGIAKLVDANAGQTLTGGQALTPEYASPEQIRGRPITTATDIYSLGVVAYELLTGRKPYALDTTDITELARVICERPPDVPKLGGDLDHILLMALRKEPERRYASMRELVEDIERSQSNRPVHARPDTLIYRAGRFGRRYRTPLTAAAMVAVALIGGVIASQRSARRAERRFDDVRGLANSFLIDVNARLQGASTPAREQIVSTALAYLERLAAEAGGDATLGADLTAAYQAVGDIQSESLGRIDDARRSYAKAVDLGERLMDGARTPPAVRKALAATYLGLLEIDYRHGDLERAMTNGQKALALAEGADPRNDWSSDFLITAYGKLVRPYLQVGQPVQALAACRKGLRLEEERRTSPASEGLPYRRALLHLGCAQALKNRGDLPASATEATRARDLFASMPDRTDPRFVSDGINFLLGPGAGEGPGPPDLFPRLSTAADRKQALDLATQAAARDPLNSSLGRWIGVTNWARSMDLLEVDRESALEHLRAAVKMGDELLAKDPSSATLRGNLSLYEAYLGEALASTADAREAFLHLKRGVELAEGAPTASPMLHWRAIEALRRMGAAEARAGEFDDARAHLERCLKYSLALWPGSREDLRSFAYIGMSYAAIGDMERLAGNEHAACDAYRKSVDTWRAWPAVGVSSFYDREHAARVDAKLERCSVSR